MKKIVAVALACAGAVLICAGLRAAGKEMIKSIEDCGFFESIPLWAVTIIGSRFITIMSFIIITVYGRFFKLYIYTAIAPIPLATFAGQPTQNVGQLPSTLGYVKLKCGKLIKLSHIQ